MSEHTPDNPPEWAMKRVHDLTYQNVAAVGSFSEQVQDAFARYIATKEEPPVEPLLIEARSLCRHRYSSDAEVQSRLHGGKCDDHSDVKLALSALRRGMELARSKGEV